jgi:hypothetical protein
MHKLFAPSAVARRYHPEYALMAYVISWDALHCDL